MSPRTLSKSRFKLACECPTKVHYSLDRHYANAKDDEEFLQALAEGGVQVGELAKALYRRLDPAAVEVTDPDGDQQLAQTTELLQREDVTIFEATVRHGQLLVRVDVLVKRGNVIELVEVKSKGYRPDDPRKAFRGQQGGIRSGWLPYFRDVAFQAYVLRRALPGVEVRPYLMLVDPTVAASSDWLDPPLLKAHDASAFVDEILAGAIEAPGGAWEFDDFVEMVSQAIAAGRKIDTPPGAQCKRCEFYVEPAEASGDKRSGWAECIERHFPGRGKVPRSATVLALANHRKAGELLAQGKLLLTDLDEDDLGDKRAAGSITPDHRHLLQLREARGELSGPVLCHDRLQAEMIGWTFPLHFIDFETARPTLPFIPGRHPNDQLLFQFSHHVLQADGRLVHRSQCLVADPGVDPNAPVLRALRDALAGDRGTVLHWWSHEATVLKELRRQLAIAEEPDAAELLHFIGSLVDSVDGEPPRLVDMGLPLVSKTAFFPGTEGRSSIKKVLLAVLAQSGYLRERYGRPVYGTQEMPSLNHATGFAWWREEGGRVLDPYDLLGRLLEDPALDAAAARLEDEDDGDPDFIANGGAAMLAYAQLQRPDLDAAERRRLSEQLLRYCELDTLAMVMVYEALREWLRMLRSLPS